MEKGNKKIINAWATFDLANSVYNLVITATIFPIYYKAVTDEEVTFLGMKLKNTTLYDLALAFAFLVVAAIIPLLSGIADAGGNKKRFLQFFTYLGAAACITMFWFDETNLGLGITCAVLACVGYAGGLVFYNAYLPEIAEPHQQDKVSAKGFAWGYFGSAFLLIANLVFVMFPELLGHDVPGKTQELMLADPSLTLEKATSNAKNFFALEHIMPYSFLSVGIWWIVFSSIPFYFLPNNVYNKKAEGNPLTKGYRELLKVWRDLKHNKKLTRFLPAFFIYSMGVQTVMLVANHFGADEIKMKAGQLITTILIIQFVAMAGAYLFSYLSKLKGNLFTLKAATIIWSLICIGTFFLVYTPVHFYVVAGFVGLVMGGTQALSRSTYSKMLPETEDHSSYFSFYDVTEKLSIVCGMATFGLINELSPTMRQPIVALIVFFILGYILLLRVPRDEKR